MENSSKKSGSAKLRWLHKVQKRVVGKKSVSQKFVSINFLDENGKPLVDLEIGVNDNKFYKRTDGKGNVRFEYSEI